MKKVPLMRVGTQLLLLVVFGSACSVAAMANQRSLSRASELYKESGLQDLVQQIPASTTRSFDDLVFGSELPVFLDQIDMPALRVAVPEAFSVHRIESQLMEEIDARLDEADISGLLAWYRTPLGQRVRTAEQDYSLLTHQDQFTAFQRAKSLDPAADDRIELINRLDKTMAATESAVDTMMTIQIAFAMSLSPVLPLEQQLSMDAIVRMARENQNQLIELYRLQTRDALLFIYQDLSIDDLQAFNMQLTTVAGQRFVIAGNRGLTKGMFAAGIALGESISELVSPLPIGPSI